MSFCESALVMARSRSAADSSVSQTIRTALAPVFAISSNSGMPSFPVLSHTTLSLPPRSSAFSPQRS
jgi:hypothetical protein